MKKKDLIAQAQSGTGKTGAFTIGALNLLDHDLKKTQVLILNPTYELVNQNYDVTKALRTLKKKLQNEGVFNELRERVAFQTRGEKKRLARAAGRRRYLKNKQKLKETRGY